MLHYGSTKSFHTPKLSVTSLSRIFTIPETTIHNVLSRFRKQGKKIDTFVDRRSLRVRFVNFTKRMKQFLLRKSTLQAWAGKSLVERS